MSARNLGVRPWLLRAAGLGACLLPAPAMGQGAGVQGVDLQRLANAVLSLTSYSVVPDPTTSSLSIDNRSTSNAGVRMAQLGGGFTLSDRPLYLEGALAYSHYDPQFVVEQGSGTLTIPFEWNSATATAGVGWDFRLTDTLVWRPIFNLSYGTLTSDAKGGLQPPDPLPVQQAVFLDGGHLNSFGVGGSLMLVYKDRKPARDIDVELRYTNIQLRSFGNTAVEVQGHAVAETLGLWARWRAPTGLTLMDRPLRYVLETAHSEYLGSQAGTLGFNRLTYVGGGVELDFSAKDLWVTRTRLMGYHLFGNNISGTSIGLGLTF